MATQAASATIDQLIISSPYDEPKEHWKYDRETRRFTREPGRRPAGYVRASDAPNHLTIRASSLSCRW